MNRRNVLLAAAIALPLPRLALAAVPASRRFIEYCHEELVADGEGGMAFAIGRWQVGEPFAVLPESGEIVPVPDWVVDLAKKGPA